MTEALTLRVTDIRAEARDVILIELKAPGDRPLPAFTPGAHLEITLPNGLIRHYSLCNDPRERGRYVIGVGRDENSRGGSVFLHQSLKCGATLAVRGPRNNFPLDPDARGFLFIAGGIGITPIMAMVRACRADGRPWRLIYATRNRQRTAFYEELAPLGAEHVRFHFDDEAGGVLDVAAALGDAPEDHLIYGCGPEPLLAALARAALDHTSRDLPEGRLRVEHFTAPAATDPEEGPDHPLNEPFQIHLKQSGRTLEVPPDKSILEVLEGNGFDLPFSCREGLCRTCETAVCAGDIDHRDYVLSAEEQAAGTSMMICVSRARSVSLTLDL